jgi:hypothetical protein
MKTTCYFAPALIISFLSFLSLSTAPASADDEPKLVTGTGEGWKELGEADFVNVNGNPDTWTWKDGVLHCTGQPVGVIRTAKQYTNFELVVEWKHLRHAGNSGVFIWTTPDSIAKIKPGQLPRGIECQVLDHGYKENYEKGGKKADWFTTNGDVFAVGTKLKPFPPLSPNGSRSFPKKETTKGFGHWNHYYIRCVDGEIRLTVNGVEVSGGSDADPATGYVSLESEGSPIEFKNIRIKELP